MEQLQVQVRFKQGTGTILENGNTTYPRKNMPVAELPKGAPNNRIRMSVDNISEVTDMFDISIIESVELLTSNSWQKMDLSTGNILLTFGQQLCGITFNPSGDEKVLRAKQICAELADMVNDNVEGQATSYLYNLIKGKALGEILNAQMNVVKLLTLKY